MKLPRVYSLLLSGLLFFGFTSTQASTASYEMMKIIVESQNKNAPTEEALNEFNIDPMTYAAVVMAGKIDLQDGNQSRFFFDSVLPLVKMLDEASHVYLMQDRRTAEYRQRFGHPEDHKARIEHAAMIVGLLTQPSPNSNTTCLFPVSGLNSLPEQVEHNFGLPLRIGTAGQDVSTGSAQFVFSVGEDFCNPEIPAANYLAPRKNNKCCDASDDDETSDVCKTQKKKRCTLRRIATSSSVKKCTDTADDCDSTGGSNSFSLPGDEGEL